MPSAPPQLHKHWSNAGPYAGHADSNAMDHLLRYNFKLVDGWIYPPKGYELSKEDKLAIDYLIMEWDWGYAPLRDDTVKPPPQTKPASRS